VLPDPKDIEKDMKEAVTKLEKKYSALQVVPVTSKFGNPMASSTFKRFVCVCVCVF
jgi:hypothetical protein